MTPQNWEDFSRYNKERAEQEIRRSERLRDMIRQAINQTTNDLNAQHNATDFALRKRIQEFECARDELEWQKRQTEEEIARLLEDIAGSFLFLLAFILFLFLLLIFLSLELEKFISLFQNWL